MNSSPKIQSFFTTKNIISEPKQIESNWRGENNVFVVSTVFGSYVLKKVNQASWKEEVAYVKELYLAYPSFVPEIFIDDGAMFVMEFIEGEDLKAILKKPFSESLNILQSVGVQLSKVFEEQFGNLESASSVNQVLYALRYCTNDSGKIELKNTLLKWRGLFNKYPAQMIHNDLNTCNCKVTSEGTFRSIDPRADVFKLRDIAKDIGRLTAAVTCAAFDGLYNNTEVTLIANCITAPWIGSDKTLVQRVAFYVAQSYLSFSRWNTKELKKGKLFEIGEGLLNPGPNKYNDFSTLNESLVNLLFSNFNHEQ